MIIECEDFFFWVFGFTEKLKLVSHFEMKTFAYSCVFIPSLRFYSSRNQRCFILSHSYWTIKIIQALFYRFSEIPRRKCEIMMNHTNKNHEKNSFLSLGIKRDLMKFYWKSSINILWQMNDQKVINLMKISRSWSWHSLFLQLKTKIHLHPKKQTKRSQFTLLIRFSASAYEFFCKILF